MLGLNINYFSYFHVQYFILICKILDNYEVYRRKGYEVRPVILE
jgi:hypothetical protein